MAVVVMAEVERVEADPVEAAATQVRQEEKDLLVENPSLAQPEVGLSVVVPTAGVAVKYLQYQRVIYSLGDRRAVAPDQVSMVAGKMYSPEN